MLKPTLFAAKIQAFGLLCVALCCGIAACGCARWTQEKSTETNAPQLLHMPQPGPDSVTIEAVVVRFGDKKLDAMLDIWQRVDESVLDLEMRRRLDRNGLRVGVLRADLPPALRQQLELNSDPETASAVERVGLAADAEHRMRQFTSRAGRRKELYIRRELLEPLTIVTTLDGRIAGASYESASILFDLRTIPHGDGGCTVSLTPEVLHGSAQQTYVTSDYGLRPEMRRKQANWKELAIETKLTDGDTLVVTKTEPGRGLGNAFFSTRTIEGTYEHTMLLLRVVDNDLDDLFAPERVEQARMLTER